MNIPFKGTIPPSLAFPPSQSGHRLRLALPFFHLKITVDTHDDRRQCCVREANKPGTLPEGNLVLASLFIPPHSHLPSVKYSDSSNIIDTPDELPMAFKITSSSLEGALFICVPRVKDFA
ncbi:hypothetical protein PoB_002160700 [Plakobranchus ocellatus]|uniref:Uncharacterized protein n=1 Tax=Plakobranchus ocellatus TaxID=259542 RepID=A0AAV3ZIF4_9GAST|nr:hypothetical protein PoB_002160700 [Plakobranchus ocellatus]